MRQIFTIKDKKDKGFELVTTLMSRVVSGLEISFLQNVAEKAFVKGCEYNAPILSSCFENFARIFQMKPESIHIT